MPERKRAILARNGFQTYATTRNLAKSENIKSVASKENLPLPPLDEPESLEFSSSLTLPPPKPILDSSLPRVNE